MSSSVVRDIISLIAELGHGVPGKDLYTAKEQELRKPVHGILVEQRNTAPVPDVLNHTDILYINITVRGSGGGEKGAADAERRVLALYRDLNLILDRVIDGTLYLCITPDSAPYAVENGQSVDQIFGLEIIRYYGDE